MYIATFLGYKYQGFFGESVFSLPFMKFSKEEEKERKIKNPLQ